MAHTHKRSSFSAAAGILELEDLLERIFVFIEDCSAISLVCKKWYNVDRRTRKKVTVTSCYAINPTRLTGRFQALQAIKIRGKPRAAMFRLVPDEWGGFARPWISEISLNCTCLNSIYLRRMVVTDEELCTLASARGSLLQVLKLVKCSGFSTTGLEAITTHCRALRVLSVEECSLDDHSGRWLHELSHHNSSLESLNIAGTDLQNVTIDDLATLTSNCKSLTSLKLNELELENLADILKSTTALQELGGVSISDELPRKVIALPSRLTSLVSLYYMGAEDGDEVVNSLIRPIAASLRKIDLQFAFLSVPGHCELLGHCSNLEALEVFNAIGDEGLEVIASQCKSLRWLRVERGDNEFQQGFVTQKGLISVALNCHLLEYIAVYVTDINNAALKTIASNCPDLKDFRLVLLDEDNVVSDYPLDDGVRALMQGCPDIHHFALYLRPGFLTDKGMEAIGLYGQNLKWALFGLLGETDEGITLFANGCPNLKRLEIRDCVFTERALASSVFGMKSLNYVWVQGYKSTGTGRDLLPLTQDNWNVELIDEPEAPAQFVAYRCLSGKRTDAPAMVTVLG
ncbi:hypothetical protein L7F22_056662 [Adiantum nelumboides]|nr:hypothetical protein [Adiantum nelumboides]